MPLFLMGCFPVEFQEAKRPLRTKSVKRPIKEGKRPINEGKRPIKAMVLVGISVGRLMGCFRAPPPWRKTAPLKRSIKRSMRFVRNIFCDAKKLGSMATPWRSTLIFLSLERCPGIFCCAAPSGLKLVHVKAHDEKCRLGKTKSTVRAGLQEYCWTSLQIYSKRSESRTLTCQNPHEAQLGRSL